MTSGRPFAVVAALALLGVVGFGVYWVVRFGLGLYGGMDPALTTVTVTAALAVLVGALSVAGGLREIGRRETAAQQRAMRAVVYQRLLDAAPAAERPGGSPAADSGILLHASADVLKAYQRLQGADGSSPDDLARLVRAMRRDLGQRAPDVSPAELAELLHALHRNPPTP